MTGTRGLVAWVVRGLLAVTAFMPLMAQEGAEGEEYLRRRLEWFESQRAYPNREMDREAMARVRLQLMQQAGRRGLPSIASSSGSWIPMGPTGFFGMNYWGSAAQLDAGRIDAIALHPTDPATLFIASPNGGIWRSTTGGASWSPLFDAQCTLQMATVQVDPVNPSIIYAGAADPSGAAGCGLFRSSDGGATWGNWNGGLNFTSSFSGAQTISGIFIDPSSAGSLTATTMLLSTRSGGMYRSTNSGISWSHSMSAGYVSSIVALPGHPGVIFAGVVNSMVPASTGLYRSADNGATWVRVQSGGSFGNAGRLQLAVSPAQPNSVWVLTGLMDSKYGSLLRWDDVTGALVPLAASGVAQTGRTAFGAQARYDLALAVDVANASRIYIAGVRGFRSTDGGATFVAMGTEIHCDWQTIVVDPRNPQQLYAGTDGGIYASTDGGDSWVSRNAGLSVTMYYPGVAQHPTDANIVVGGLQDNGSLLSNGTQWFSSVGSGDGGFAAINYFSPSTMWTTCQWLPGPCLTKHVGNSSFGNVTSGISTSDRAAFLPPLLMDPVTPTTLYFGTMRLYRTTNDGLSWTAISADLTKGTSAVSAIAVALSDPQVIYAGTFDGNVQVTRNGGTSWALSTTGLPNRAVTDIAIDGANPLRALVTFSGSGSSHVYLTSDAGTTWASVSGNLPDMPTNAVVMINDGTSHFFVGTDVGVFETTDTGLTWSASPTGLPNVVVNDLSYNTSTRQLVAATYGRGLFKYSLANPAAVLRGDVNRDGVVNAADALLIQQALIGLQLPAGLTVLPQGDSNCDGKLDVADALIVLRASVGLSTASACVGTVK